MSGRLIAGIPIVALLSRISVHLILALNDIALLLCIKYAYFLRNRYQHGIVIANNFKLAETADEKELPIINDILTTVIFELLQNCAAIPQKV